jgi:hypothetical protein
MNLSFRTAIALIILCFVLSESKAQNQVKLFRDTTDNAIDISNWLSTVTGFVPIVMPITEPAIGYGAAGGLVFFHPNEFRRAAKEGRLNDPQFENISPTPPSITAVGGAYTENGTWMTGAGHSAVWKEDRIRYSIGAGGGSVNLDYYGNFLLPDQKRRFNTKMLGVTNEITFRLAESDFWLGLGYSFAKLDIEFEKKFDWPDWGFNKRETQNGSLFPTVIFDNRDNIFTPNRGVRIYMKFNIHDKWLGGTEKYQSFASYLLGYHQWAPGHVSGIRFDWNSTFGDPTFIYLPFLVIRGLPAMRYQDKNTALLEFEQRIKIYNRWSLIAFAGTGKAFPEISQFDEVDWVSSYGTGFRYYIARKFGTHMGMDFAWGPDDFVFYITFGSAWMRL